jgi:hypothetical protein
LNPKCEKLVSKFALANAGCAAYALEHLPNTLRQALVYDALKFPRPQFGHMSLILAPDRSKVGGAGLYRLNPVDP